MEVEGYTTLSTYFVLDIENDPHARKALEFYAVEVAKDDPELANYIWKVYLNRANN